MDIKEIVSGSLKLPWLAGTRIKSLTRHNLQKCELRLIIAEVKNKPFSLKCLGILLYGFCTIACKLHEYIEEELTRMLRTNTETPHRGRISDVSTTSGINLMGSALKYSGGKLSILQVTPPSLEITRKGFNARIEDITLIDYKNNEESRPNHFGIDDFLDDKAYQDTLSLGMNVDLPEEIATPRLSPNLQQNVRERSTVKRKKIKANDAFTVYKIANREIVRKYKDMCLREKNAIEFPAEMKEMVKYFQGEPAKEEADHVVVEIEKENLSVADRVEPETYDIREITPVKLDLNFEFEGESPEKKHTPIKSTQTVRFEEKVKWKIETKGKCRLEELIEGKDRTADSKAFASLMVLVATNEVKIKQDRPFGHIVIYRV